ncbi:cation:proton antiporter domain-containing protein [Microbacterium aurum]
MDLLLVILVGVVAVAVVTTLAQRLGVAGPLLLVWKHGTVIVWAGMRGVVALAAAQTIPRTVESRPELIYIAFVVALVSLMLQGFTLPWVVRKLRLSDPAEASDSDERERLDDELRTAAASAVATGTHLARRGGKPFDPELLQRMGLRYAEPPSEDWSAHARELLELQLAVIEVMRTRLIEVSTGGTFSTAALRHRMAELDADQLSLELRLRDDDGA